LVVIGNVCTSTHVEAAAAKEMGLHTVSMPHALHDLFLADTKNLIIAGTHGKTTTTALTAFLLEKCGKDPGVMVGGITKDFGSGFKKGGGEYFTVEGDEYDSAYFEKIPKFISYAPTAAVITSVEYDHIDIYPTEQSYFDAFVSFAELVKEGPLAVFSGDSGVRRIMEDANIECQLITYGVDGDDFLYEPAWFAKPKSNGEFKLYVEGLFSGVWKTPLMGVHNLRNTLAALIMAHKGAGIPLEELKQALPLFGGVARRQQLIGTPGNINVYDDFAHHPTAVSETIKALKSRHSKGKLIAAFEPRSATACRNIHQEEYGSAFDNCDIAIIAPPGRDLPAEESLDTELLVHTINQRGIKAVLSRDFGEVLMAVDRFAKPGDTIVLFSNGAFGGLHGQIINLLNEDSR
jgi:UDP-N-acetylmuramate: L-alanyl-gamma-D-glutamyl-meso-diaminopimelate ligase